MYDSHNALLITPPTSSRIPHRMSRVASTIHPSGRGEAKRLIRGDGKRDHVGQSVHRPI